MILKDNILFRFCILYERSFLNGFILGYFLFSFISTVQAQKQVSSFDSVYTHAATTLSGTDIQKAIQVADSLVEYSDNNVQKMKSLMLLATLKGRVGDITNALSTALQAESIARKDRNYEWQVRIAGFLSTTFREVNLTAESQKYLAIAEKANERTKSDSPTQPIIQSFIHQEKAYYKIGEKDYRGAIEELHRAEAEISRAPKQNRSVIFSGTNYQLLGVCFIGLEDYEKAAKCFDLALQELGELKTELKAFVYTGQGEIELHRQHYDAAYGLFKKAEAYIETSGNANLKTTLYKNLAVYFKVLGNQDEAMRYNDLYVHFMEVDSKSSQAVSNQLIEQFHAEKDKKVRHVLVLLSISFFLILTIVLLVIRFQRIRKKERRKVKAILARIDEALAIGKRINIDPKAKSGFLPRNESLASIMPKETEERLLHELTKQEGVHFYLQKDISLSAMATKLQTNPKYLSYIINTYKGQDFNNYINELRIAFAIDRLHHDPQYRQYKLAYIAGECGFSSHSKFGAVFKKSTGVSPSAFISHLRQEQLN